MVDSTVAEPSATAAAVPSPATPLAPAKTKCEGNVCVCDDGLRCQVATCSTGSTTITGKVYDPAGANPLYNVMVFVPNTTLPTISHGPSCDQCPSDTTQLAALYGDPITAAITAADGTFTLTNAPSGSNIPLVFQIGKWRRQVTIPTVTACATTNVSAADTPTSKFARLPKKSERRRLRDRIAAQDCRGGRRRLSAANQFPKRHLRSECEGTAPVPSPSHWR